jgi:hypothetical protein
MFGKSSATKTPSLVGRFFRLVFSVVVLSALILGVVIGAKEFYKSDTETLAQKLTPLLAKLKLNIDEKEVGQVAGKFVERISQTNLGSGVTSSRPEVLIDNALGSGSNGDINTNGAVSITELFRVAIVADIHDDLENFSKALSLAKNKGVQKIILLGDETNYGDITALEKIKSALTNSGLEYEVLPGDHDLAQSVGIGNFTSVFGNDVFTFELNGYKFLGLDNSFNYTSITADKMAWLENNMTNVQFVFLSQPLFTTGLSPFFEKIYMGSSNTEVTDPALKEKQEQVLDQGVFLLSYLRSFTSLKAIIAGEHHKSSVLQDPAKSNVKHLVVGAVSNTVKDYPQNLIQSPRFSILTVFNDGTYKVDDIVL